MQPEFDVIVVGAGPAGAASALTLARKGFNVIMLEKAKIPGERNVTGGVLYGDFSGKYGLIDLVPEFEAEAPVERKVVSHEVYVVSNARDNKYRYYKMNRSSAAVRIGIFSIPPEGGHDYTVLRRGFDRWFALKAVEAGAMLSTSTTVEGLLKEGNAVIGVKTPQGDINSKVVIDCSGVTSPLVEEAGLREQLGPSQLYHGVKHVLKLDEETVNSRFGVKKGEGKAMALLGEFMDGISGGAFIYTNRETISIGMVVSMNSMLKKITTDFTGTGKLLDVLERLEGNPLVAELIDGSEVLEYSAHNIPKSYKCILKRPYTDGFMVAGDALGSFVKIGSMIDGMRRAIASGMMAAEAFIGASTSGSYGAGSLARYMDILKPIYRDVARSGRDSTISESSLAYSLFPKLVLATGLTSKEGEVKVMKPIDQRDAIQRIQDGTSLLNYDEDKDYAHIKVNAEGCSRALDKPWVPACPVNCYTILTSKGVFASLKDLYIYNLKKLQSDAGAKGGTEKNLRYRALLQSRKDVALAGLRFDWVACVECGTCGAIGPKDMVDFHSEKDGHGVRYKFG
ncbi:MAG: FAD-dependent oxidoreductase [Nitrososphaerota archaeon]|nr:FAD-dependent oxidoreductase [Nitrososphaerota archaeon]MDG7048938.1 FAD-dependent oxidoreductase [Nitrososphaerota archaeon]MDG7051949.1 FAD-dependent oxidoreductase [Nitrososphaerota archaeon]